MTGLMVLAAVLVSATVAVALYTAREIAVLKQHLTRLEQIRQETHEQLQEILHQHETIQGTRDLLAKVKKSRNEKIRSLEEEFQKLEQEVEEEHEISLSKPLKKQSLEEG